MATVGQIYYQIFDEGEYNSNIDENIFFGEDGANIVTAYDNATQFTKIGIQAPPGTQVVMNGKTIMVGRTGIYELTDIAIKKMYFIKPKEYERNETKSNEAIIKGAKGMQAAEATKDASLENIGTLDDNPTVEQSKQYAQTFTAAQTEFNDSYGQALNEYNRGKYGVYDLKGEKPLYNVIVDFLYE